MPVGDGNDPVVIKGEDDRDTVYSYPMDTILKKPEHELYSMEGVIASGTFGVVYHCSSFHDKKAKLACKRVFQDARYKNRELECLLLLNTLEEGNELVRSIHPNVLDRVTHYYTDGERPGDKYLNIVSSCLPDTIGTRIKHMNKTKSVFPQLEVKLYMY